MDGGVEQSQTLPHAVLRKTPTDQRSLSARLPGDRFFFLFQDRMNVEADQKLSGRDKGIAEEEQGRDGLCKSDTCWWTDEITFGHESLNFFCRTCIF